MTEHTDQITAEEFVRRLKADPEDVQREMLGHMAKLLQVAQQYKKDESAADIAELIHLIYQPTAEEATTT